MEPTTDREPRLRHVGRDRGRHQENRRAVTDSLQDTNEAEAGKFPLLKDPELMAAVDVLRRYAKHATSDDVPEPTAVERGAVDDAHNDIGLRLRELGYTRVSFERDGISYGGHPDSRNPDGSISF